MKFFGMHKRQDRSIPPNATFKLTQEGKEKLQEFQGDTKSRILVALETHGTSDIDEIAECSGLKRGEVERCIPVMIRGGYVQYVSASTVED